MGDPRNAQDRMGNVGMSIDQRGFGGATDSDLDQRRLSQMADHLMNSDNLIQMAAAQGAFENRPAGLPSEVQFFSQRQERPAGPQNPLMAANNYAGVPQMPQHHIDISGSSGAYFQAQ